MRSFAILYTDHPRIRATQCCRRVLLAHGKNFDVFIGGSVGSFGHSGATPTPRIAFSTGLEAAVTGTRVFDNLSAGLMLYYPTFYLKSGEVNVTAGLFLYYNF